MGKVIIDITMSLDGFIAGTDISRENPLGIGGLRLHDWLFSAKTERDQQLLAEVTAGTGAVLTGARTYITAIDDAWGGVTPFEVPVFVVIDQTPAKLVEGFTYVNDGIHSALKQAQAVAGDKNVWIMGGAGLIQQYLKAGLIDEMHIHIVPVLFANGTRLFDNLNAEHVELERLAVVETPAATHIRFRIVK